ncbi:MAG: gliding motility-associated C-terminal domain-containing protein [Saprospiraceae bacterium]
MNISRIFHTDPCSAPRSLAVRPALHALFFLFINLLVINAFAQPPVQWDRTYGGDGYEELHAIAPVDDGGFIFAGATQSEASGDIPEAGRGDFDYWIVRTDSEGEMIWNKRFGGDGRDKVWSVIQTPDGGFLVGGESNSDVGGDRTVPNRGGLDYWIVKISATGNKEWDRAIGGAGEDILRIIVSAEDGGYLLGGYSNSDAGGEKTDNSFGAADFWLVKIDGIGNIQWDRTFGGDAQDQLLSIKPTFDNEFILGGWSQSGISGVKTEANFGLNDFWIIKMTENGDFVWDKTYGGSGEDVLQDVEPTSDGSFVLGGFSQSPISGNKITGSLGKRDYYLIKVNRNGNRIWERTLGGVEDDLAYEVRETRAGNYAIAGQTASGFNADKTENQVGFQDYWLLTLDPDGNEIWSEVYGGSGSDALAELDIAVDGGFIMAGQSGSDISGDKTQNSVNLGDIFENDFWVIKTSCGQPEMIGNDTTLCQNDLLILDATVPNCEDCTYTWDDSSIQPRRVVLPADGSVYKVTIIDQNGCVVEDSVLTEVLPIPVGAAMTIEPPSCFGDQDGMILIDEITGGTQPYNYIINEEEPTQNPDFVNMISGKYELSIIDGNQCQLDTTIILEEPNQMQISLGGNPALALGDSVTIRVLTNQNLSSVRWSNSDLINCMDPDCFTISVRPIESASLAVTAMNANGCEATDNIAIAVSKERPIYFPNAFSPNDDGFNDFFLPQPGKAVTRITNFQIYDRWGQLMYELPELLPNKLPLGWDGKFRNRPLNPGIFYYVAQIEYFDDWMEEVTGEINLVR